VKFLSQIFHLECGYGFRSNLNVYHWLKMFAKTETFRENHPGEKFFSRKFSRKHKFLLIFAFCENEKRGFRFNSSDNISPWQGKKLLNTTCQPISSGPTGICSVVDPKLFITYGTGIRIRLFNEFRIRIQLSKSSGSCFGSDLFPKEI
jgi:hypothetical protein